MAWNYRYPTREWWESEEEYEARVEAYEAAEDDYADEAHERYLEERYS